MLGTREEFYTAIVITSVFAFLLISIIIITAVLYHNRKKRYLQEKARFTRILLESQLEIKEQTLRHIAFELHDNLGQIASLIKINLETLRLDQPATAAEQVEDTKELARQTEHKQISPCDPAVAQRHTGYMVGGTSPFGTRKVLPVFMERSILDLPLIYINGGKRGFLVGVHPHDILRILHPGLVSVALK